jgi:hypothetical protein
MLSRFGQEVKTRANESTNAQFASTFRNVLISQLAFATQSAIADEISAPVLDSDSGYQQKP